MHQIQRAIFDLRRGMPVVVGTTLVYPTELVDPQLVSLLDGQSASLVISKHRWAALNQSTQATAVALQINACDGLVDFASLNQAASAPNADLSTLFDTPRPATDSELGALALMRRALLLPAAVTVPVEGALAKDIEPMIEQGWLLKVDTDSSLRCHDLSAGMIRRISEADVPLAKALKTRFILFREADGLREHVAVVIGTPDQWPEAVPVRLHSSCLTGDLFGSLRCDCGEQLQNAVEAIEKLGGGVLLYLAQEGRGIGLGNKLRAYELQDQGLDTVDADQLLGFGEDERGYRVAVDMLTNLDINTIHLLTNNPIKLNALESGGIDVASRGSLFGSVTDQNRRYLSAKAERSGHWLDEVLELP